MLPREVRSYIITFLSGNLNSNERAPLHAAFNAPMYPPKLGVVTPKTPLSALYHAKEIHGVNGCVCLDMAPMPRLRVLVVNYRRCRRLCPYCYTKSKKPRRICANCGNEYKNAKYASLSYPLIAPRIEYIHVDMETDTGLPPAYSSLRRLAITNWPNGHICNLSKYKSLRYFFINDSQDNYSRNQQTEYRTVANLPYLRRFDIRGVKTDVYLHHLPSLKSIAIRSQDSHINTKLVRLHDLPALERVKVRCGIFLLGGVLDAVRKATIKCHKVAQINNIPSVVELKLICRHIVASDNITLIRLISLSNQHKSILRDLRKIEFLHVECDSLVRIENINPTWFQCVSKRSVQRVLNQ